MSKASLSRYAAEALGTALLMAGIVSLALLLEHPASGVHQALTSASLRRLCMGVGMGTVIAGISYSAIGRRSGAHLNPSLTLAMLRAGRIGWRDAAGYVASQFLGACAAMAAFKATVGDWLAHPRIGFVTTVPAADAHHGAAFAAEAAMSFGLMTIVLLTGRSRRVAPYTGAMVGVAVALFIWAEAPLSGMSLNPARTVGAALAAERWTALWIYFAAPTVGMLAAVEMVGRQAPARAG